MRKLLYFCMAFTLFSLFACAESEQQRIARLTQEWTGKPIYVPADSVFESFETDSIRKYSLKRAEYTIVTYVDSNSCTNEDLKLTEWKEFLASFQSATKGKATCLFFFHPESRQQMVHTLRTSDFNYPVCIDEDNIYYKLNRFPSDSLFNTFLIDKDYKVVAMGNPVRDPKIKELYLDIITGKS